MKTIAIFNRKGGVAKTATAHALGAGLTHKGYSVLFIDLDPQTNLTYELRADEEAPINSMEVLRGNITAEEAIQHTEGGDIIGGSEELALADIELNPRNVYRAEYRLRNALEPLAGSYDYCILDLPPALGVLAINALTASNSVVIPTWAGRHSLRGLKLLHDTIRVVQEKTNPDLEIAGILITLFRTDTILAKDMKKNAEETGKKLGIKVFKTPIRENTDVGEAQAMQRDIFTYSPRSIGAKDYQDFVDEMERSTRK